MTLGSKLGGLVAWPQSHSTWVERPHDLQSGGHGRAEAGVWTASLGRRRVDGQPGLEAHWSNRGSEEQTAEKPRDLALGCGPVCG